MRAFDSRTLTASSMNVSSPINSSFAAIRKAWNVSVEGSI